MSGPNEILTLSLSELAARLRSGDTTSVAATEAVLGALDGPGRALNATARLHAEEALAEAEACDAERAKGMLRGPLHGVPLAHKDMFHRAGRLSELGSKIYRGHVPAQSATVIERLDKAGAIDVGRLNMVEFALGVTGHNAHTGHPRNAFDPSRITGGSSSGGATAVAGRLTFATLGSDTGGSIRTPASLCGIVGLKPTYGRVSRAGAMPLSFSLDHVGPLARSAKDCALMLEVIAGADPRDLTSSARPVEPYRDGIDLPIDDLRIAFATEDGFETPLDPEVRAAYDEAARVLRQLGAAVTPGTLPPMAPLNALRRLVSMVEIAALHETHVRERPGDYNDTTISRMVAGFAAPATDYVRALSGRASQLQAWCDAAFAEADLVALPAVPTQTPTIDETATGGDARYLAVSADLASLIGPFNYLGLPALSTPMGFTRSGMPMGLQLVGRPFAETLLLRAAHAFEQAAQHLARLPDWVAAGTMPPAA